MCSCHEHGRAGRHLATCTFPLYRDNENPDSDEVFCPFPPSVNMDIDPDAAGQPLEYMSYFVDDYLLDLSDNQIDTTDFFRQYMAGFLISTRETALSVCRSNDTDSVNDAMCQMILATEIVEDDLAFTDTLGRQQYQNSTNCTIEETDRIQRMDGIRLLNYEDSVNCAFNGYDTSGPLDANDFPNCPNIDFDADNVTNSVFSFVSGNGTTDISQIEANFSVDGAVRNRFEGLGGHFGRVYYAPTSTHITGATVYYNNQVHINGVTCHKVQEHVYFKNISMLLICQQYYCFIL